MPNSKVTSLVLIKVPNKLNKENPILKEASMHAWQGLLNFHDISFHTLANHTLLAAIANSDSLRLFFRFERTESLDQERGSSQCKIDSCNFHPKPIFHENNHRLTVTSLYRSLWNQSERRIADRKSQEDQRRRMKTLRQWQKRLHRQVLSWLRGENKEGGVCGLWAGDDDPYREERRSNKSFYL